MIISDPFCFLYAGQAAKCLISGDVVLRNLCTDDLQKQKAWREI